MNPLSEAKLINTIWKQPESEQLKNLNINYDIVAQYFCENLKEKIETKPKPIQIVGKKVVEEINILEALRSKMLNIYFKDFKISPEEFKRILDELDDDDQKINLNQIDYILEQYPKSEKAISKEKELFKKFNGDPNLITKGEKYLYYLAVDDKALRIFKSMRIKKSIVRDALIYSTNMRNMIDGFLSIRNSKSFENILKILLKIINYFSFDEKTFGTPKSKIREGFILEYLDSIIEFKSNLKGYKLLDVWVLLIRETD